MNDQGYKFNTIAEHFPVKLRSLADSVDKTIPELRKLIWEGVYYIDESCELVESPVNKAIYDLGLALKERLPTAQEFHSRLAEVFKVLKEDPKNRELIGTAGEDLELGDCVIFGEDGKIYKAKQ
jgi:hypothetical protein